VVKHGLQHISITHTTSQKRQFYNGRLNIATSKEKERTNILGSLVFKIGY